MVIELAIFMKENDRPFMARNGDLSKRREGLRWGPFEPEVDPISWGRWTIVFKRGDVFEVSRFTSRGVLEGIKQFMDGVSGEVDSNVHVVLRVYHWRNVINSWRVSSRVFITHLS